MRALAPLLLCLLPPMASGADTIYKCIKDDRVVYSQTNCPDEYQQREMAFEFGLTHEVDSDKPKDPNDPLTELLNGKTITSEKMLTLIDSEIYRLNQENSYIEVLRASERKKLDRKRFWRGAPETDPEYLKEVAAMNQRFDEMKGANDASISSLKARRDTVATADAQ